MTPPQWFVAWAALAASLISLSISVTTFMLTHRRPRVRLELPDRVRVSDWPDRGDAYIYLQLIFINVGRSTRAEVFVPRLILKDLGGLVELDYVDKSKTVWDKERREVHVEYVEDASPIIVGQNSVRSELLTFKAPPGWRLRTGDYIGEVTASPTLSSKHIRGQFSFAITAEHVRVWRDSAGRRYAMLPARSREISSAKSG